MPTEEIEHVEPLDPTKRTSEILGDGDAGAAEAGICYYNGAKYSEGAFICERGQKMRCRGGRWLADGAC